MTIGEELNLKKTGDPMNLSEDWNNLLADVYVLKEENQHRLGSYFDKRKCEIMKEAGTQYKWGNDNDDKVDCSGFVEASFYGKPMRVPAPPPPPPPPPPMPVVNPESGWMKWLLPLLALFCLAAGIWYFTSDDDPAQPVDMYEYCPTIVVTVKENIDDDGIKSYITDCTDIHNYQTQVSD